MDLPDPDVHGGRSRGQGEELSAEELARWAPGMMRSVARALVQQIQQKDVQVRKLSWDEHVRNGHVPFRRDCAARSRPHRRQDFPEAFTLAFDTAGPFKEGKDLDNKKKKYLLVAAYTWPVLRATNEDAEDPDSLTFEGPLVAGNPYEDDDFEYAPSVVADHEGPMDVDSDEEAAIMTALGEMAADSVDYDVMDVSEVFPAKPEEAQDPVEGWMKIRLHYRSSAR